MTQLRSTGLALVLFGLALALFGLTRAPAAQEFGVDDFGEALAPRANPVRDAYVEIAVLPTYPKRALKHGIDADVTVRFTITRYGRAVDAKIVSSSGPKLFLAPTLDALKYWYIAPARDGVCSSKIQTGEQTFRFRHKEETPIQLAPLVLDGHTTLPREQRTLSAEQISAEMKSRRQLSYAVGDEALVVRKRVKPEYPEKALQRRREGFVGVKFFIEKDGSVSEPRVSDSRHGAFFNRAALSAIKQWRFEPLLKNGEPVERVGCHEFLFNLDAQALRNQGQRIRERTRREVF